MHAEGRDPAAFFDCDTALRGMPLKGGILSAGGQCLSPRLRPQRGGSLSHVKTSSRQTPCFGDFRPSQMRLRVARVSRSGPSKGPKTRTNAERSHTLIPGPGAIAPPGLAAGPQGGRLGLCARTSPFPPITPTHLARAQRRPLVASGMIAGSGGSAHRRAKDFTWLQTRCSLTPRTRRKLGSWCFATDA